MMSVKKPLFDYLSCLVDRRMMPIACKVALVVGTVLFCINHGRAMLQGNMNCDRWLSAGLTYMVPYMVNIHGQYTSRFNPSTLH